MMASLSATTTAAAGETRQSLRLTGGH